jgi:hypothetical protein
MTYTLRRTWPDNPDSSEDYEFFYKGKAVGRVYLGHFARADRWRWTIYETNLGALELTLDDAKAKFKEAFERLSE